MSNHRVVGYTKGSANIKHHLYRYDSHHAMRSALLLTAETLAMTRSEDLSVVRPIKMQVDARI